uniref:Uncharacterized protein n=1 Tax=uncultured verrucomicrobium HF0500_08N17 TaxID=723597 RepID=E7C4X5_9BACT|nr:hypothetical protein [uncultured verrucomicrobium HF0500_08N17]
MYHRNRFFEVCIPEPKLHRSNKSGKAVASTAGLAKLKIELDERLPANPELTRTE